MNKETYILSVDLGTSGPKAVLVSHSGKIAGFKRTFVATHTEGKNGAEQDPHSIWTAIKLAVQGVMAESEVSPADVEALICSSQYSSIVPVDRQGNALHGMLMWTDARGSKQKLLESGLKLKHLDTPWQLANWARLHGLAPVVEGMSLNHMRYFRFMCPSIYEKTYKLLEPMDFMAMKFTGRAATTQGNTLMSLLVDNRTPNATGYHPTLVRYGCIDHEKLPELVPSNTILGHVLPDVARELGLSEATRVVVGLNDTAAGAMGSMAFGGSHAGLCVGTSGVMVCHTDKKRTALRDSLFTMPSPDQERYFAVAENGIAGAALDKYLKNIANPSDAFLNGDAAASDASLYEALERAQGDVPPGADGLIYMPWIKGSLAPRANGAMRGGFINMSATTTRSHMARAVLEGLAFNLRWVRDPMENFVGRKFTHFNFYGGGANSSPVAQILADVLGRPIHQMNNAQFVNSIGAAMLAFERLGTIGFSDFSERLSIKRVYEPKANLSQIYDDLFWGFKSAYKANLPIFAGLQKRGVL